MDQVLGYITKIFLDCGYWDVGIMLISMCTQSDYGFLKCRPLMYQFLQQLIDNNTYCNLGPHLFTECLSMPEATGQNRTATVKINTWGLYRSSDGHSYTYPYRSMIRELTALAISTCTTLTIEHLNPFLISDICFVSGVHELWESIDKLSSDIDSERIDTLCKIYDNEPFEYRLRVYCWMQRLDLLVELMSDPLFDQSQRPVTCAHRSSLKFACQIDDIDMLAILLPTKPVEMRVEYGELLIIACRSGDLEITQVLVDKCIENKCVNDGMIVFSIPMAIRRADCDLDIIRIVLKAFKPYLELDTVYDIILWHRQERSKTYQKCLQAVVDLIEQIFPQISTYDTSLSTNKPGNRPGWWEMWL